MDNEEFVPKKLKQHKFGLPKKKMSLQRSPRKVVAVDEETLLEAKKYCCAKSTANKSLKN